MGSSTKGTKGHEERERGRLGDKEMGGGGRTLGGNFWKGTRMKCWLPLLVGLAWWMGSGGVVVCAAGEGVPERADRAASRPVEDHAAGDGERALDAGYETRVVEGWTVHVSRRLLATRKGEVDRLMELLGGQMRNIAAVVPERAVAELRKVPLWVSPEYPGVPPTAEYHPDAGWLRDHGRDPAMARGIEFTDVRSFERERKRMPMVVLHELAHAYHDRVLGFDQPDVIACYERVKANKSYDAVRRYNGPGRPETVERAYAMTSEKEYFAECSEAYFGRNDFFPFTRDELERHDPKMFKVLERVWNPPARDGTAKEEESKANRVE